MAKRDPAFKVLNTPSEIQRKIEAAINQAIKEEGALVKKFNKLNTKIVDFLVEKFLETSTYKSLMDGVLRGEFGLTADERAKVYDIILEIISSQVFIDSKKVNNLVQIIVRIVDNDDIDFNKHGVFTTEKGDVIPWFQWLLTAGDSEVVSEYNVHLELGVGRSNMAFMYRPEGGGGSYSVDSRYSGVVGNNWITRTLAQNQQEIANIINSIMGKKR